MAEFEKGGRKHELDRTQKNVDWDKLEQLTGQPRPTSGEVERTVINVRQDFRTVDPDAVMRRMAATRVITINPPSPELRAPSVAADPVVPRRRVTPWAVHCERHAFVCLTPEEYDEQMRNADDTWKCPICGAEAFWDDAHHEAMTEDVECAWEDE
jgi:hypothetical protein